jgi:VanZ family protein
MVAFPGLALERLLFDPMAKRVCAALWGLAWLVVALLLLLPISVPGPSGSDLVGHFLLFATIAFAAVGFSRRPGQLAWLMVATGALGMALEYAQGFAPYRASEVADAVANGMGALAGYAAALLVLYLVIRPAEPRYRAAP